MTNAQSQRQSAELLTSKLELSRYTKICIMIIIASCITTIKNRDIKFGCPQGVRAIFDLQIGCQAAKCVGRISGLHCSVFKVVENGSHCANFEYFCQDKAG